LGFSQADSIVGQQGLQDLLGGLVPMEPGHFIADLIRGEHCIRQSFVLGGLAEQQQGLFTLLQ